MRDNSQKTISALAIFLLLSGCASAHSLPGKPVDSRTTHALLAYFDEWRGTPYAWGGNTRRGIDCSALVKNAYARLFKTILPRSSRAQSKVGKRIDLSQLQPGDLVFFKTGIGNRHVGIYIDNGEFMHASSSKGVIRSSVYSRYWTRHFWKATRPPRLSIKG